MEINKRNRSELKQFFRINDKPTQEEFANFIDASINQAEDGIVKNQGDPLAIQAEGEEVGALGVIDVFKSFSDDNPEWSINLNPRTNPELITSNQPGFNIKDSTGESKLFIKTGDGNVGVGTIEPTSKLTVVGKNTTSLLSVIDTTNEHATVFEVSQQNGKGLLSLSNNENNTITQLSGARETPNFFLGKMGVGTTDPKTNVHISENNAQLRITNTNQTNGTSANLSIENQDSARWDIGVEKGQNHLSFGVFNGGNDRIVMKNGGKLELSDLITRESISFGTKKVEKHPLQNGIFYRGGSAATLGVKSFFFIRDINDNTSSLKFYFDTKGGRLGIGNVAPQAPLSIKGTGKTDTPDASMHITENSILFGGGNNGNTPNSGQISAGQHVPDSLNIVGVGKVQDDRKIDIWANGGMTVRGRIKTPESFMIAFSVSLNANMFGAKPKVSFGQTNYNLGGHFKNNNQFVAPVKGMYLFTMCMRNNTNDDVGWRLRLNDTGYVNGVGSESAERSQLVANAKLHMNSRTVITLLNANDTVHIEQFGPGGNDNYASGFEGMLMQELK